MITGFLTLLGAVINAHGSTVAPVSCPTVAEYYRNELRHDPAMIQALDSIAGTDPDARQCGIDETTLRLMLGH